MRENFNREKMRRGTEEEGGGESSSNGSGTSGNSGLGQWWKKY